MPLATPSVAPELVMKANRKPSLHKLTRPDFETSGRVGLSKPKGKLTGIKWQEVVKEHRDLIGAERNNGKSWPEIGRILGMDHNGVRTAATSLRIGKWDMRAVRRFIEGNLPYIRKQREIGASWATLSRDLDLPLETLRHAAVEFDPGLLTRWSKYAGRKRSHKAQQPQGPVP
jgi:hypothetical protein